MSCSAGDNKKILEQFEELVALNKKLTSLHWISAQIASEQDLNTMYNIIINGFSDITGITKCGLYLVNADEEFVEVINREKSADEHFWLCHGVNKVLKQALKDKTIYVKLNNNYCISCHHQCADLFLQICALYDHSGRPSGLLVGYDQKNTEFKDDWSKILELYALQVSLALENAILTERLRNLANTDGLTGLYNHRHFMKCLEEIHQHSRKHNGVYSLMFLDVDNFKRFNDTFGHPAGDSVLQTIASIMRDNVPHPGSVYRYGGEEFAVLLPDYELNQAYDVAEKIRAQVAGHHFKGRQVTVSIGVAECKNISCSCSYIVQMADDALYAAKSKGKNCVYKANQLYESLPD